MEKACQLSVPPSSTYSFQTAELWLGEPSSISGIPFSTRWDLRPPKRFLGGEGGGQKLVPRGAHFGACLDTHPGAAGVT